MRAVLPVISGLMIGLLSEVPVAQAQERPAAPAPTPIAEWSQQKISRMGRAIYRQDVAAGVATDALLAHLGDTPRPEGFAGWIVVEDGDKQLVRFIRNIDGQAHAAFDVEVRDGRAGEVRLADGLLPDAQQAIFRERQTATANIGRLRCSPRLNFVALPDPDSDNILVWLLTSTTDSNIVPMGGHYRFTISPDGGNVISRDMLSNSCLNMPRGPASSSQGTPVGLAVTQIVSRGPVETHVFLSLQNRMPIYVAAGERIFEVNGDRILQVRR